MAATRETDAELNAEIRKYKRKARLGMGILIVGIVLLILLALIGGIVGIVIGILVICIGGAIRGSARGAIKRCMTEAALVPALEAVFDHVEYDPDGHIPAETIRNTDMGFEFLYDKIYGSDYIKADYKGVGIEMSDIQLIKVTENYDEDGDITETESTRFCGLWLICDFYKRFSADLILREREGMGDKLLKKGIRTDSESFNKQFYIESENEHDVFYILTPHMMEYIQEMDRKAGGRTYMHFQKEGKLTLALDTGRDAFEVNKIGKANAEDLRNQFMEEIRYVTDLIDELRLVKTLHKAVSE